MSQRDTSALVGIRTDPRTHERLKAIREALQARTPFGKVTMGDALTFAVSSASAALAGELPVRAGTGHPGKKAA